MEEFLGSSSTTFLMTSGEEQEIGVRRRIKEATKVAKVILVDNAIVNCFVLLAVRVTGKIALYI